MKKRTSNSRIIWRPRSPQAVRRFSLIGFSLCCLILTVLTFVGLQWALTVPIVLEAESGPLVITTLSRQKVVEVGAPPKGALLTIRSSNPFEVGIYNMLVSNEQFDEELEIYTATVGIQGTPTISLLSGSEVTLIIRTYEQAEELPVTTRLLYSPEALEWVRAVLALSILAISVLVGVMVGLIFHPNILG